MLEIWKPVVGFETLYEVSNIGNVRRLVATNRAPAGYYLKARLLGKKGKYLAYGLHRDGKQHWRMVHIVVLEAFVGPRPKGMQGRHLNDDQLNNELSNLAWGTFAQNIEDKVRNGCCAGRKNGRAKLNQSQVDEIHRLSKLRVRQIDIANALGISQPRVSEVVRLGYQP